MCSWFPWGNLSIRPNIEVVIDASESRGSCPLHTSPLSIIPRAVVEEFNVSESEKDDNVRGGRVENIVNSESWWKC